MAEVQAPPAAEADLQAVASQRACGAEGHQRRRKPQQQAHPQAPSPGPLFCSKVRLDIVNGIQCLDIKGDRLSNERLYKDLHAATKSEDQVEGGLFLEGIVRQSSPILQLLTSKDKSLLVRWDTFFILNLCLHIVLHTGLFQSQPPCWTALTKLSKKGDGLCLRLPCKGDLASTRQARLHSKIPKPCGHSTGVGGLAPAACPCSGSLGWRGSQAPGPCTRSHG